MRSRGEPSIVFEAVSRVCSPSRDCVLIVGASRPDEASRVAPVTFLCSTDGAGSGLGVRGREGGRERLLGALGSPGWGSVAWRRLCGVTGVSQHLLDGTVIERLPISLVPTASRSFDTRLSSALH